MKKVLLLLPLLLTLSCKQRSFNNAATQSVPVTDKGFYSQSEFAILTKRGEKVVRTLCPNTSQGYGNVNLENCRSNPVTRDWSSFSARLRTIAKLPDSEFEVQVAKLQKAMEKGSVKDLKNDVKKELRENLNQAFIEAGRDMNPLRDDELIGSNGGSGFGSFISFTIARDMKNGMKFVGNKVYTTWEELDALPKGSKGSAIRIYKYPDDSNHDRTEDLPDVVFKAGTRLVGQISPEGRFYSEGYNDVVYIFFFGDADKLQYHFISNSVPDRKVTVGEFKKMMAGVISDVEIRP